MTPQPKYTILDLEADLKGLDATLSDRVLSYVTKLTRDLTTLKQTVKDLRAKLVSAEKALLALEWQSETED